MKAIRMLDISGLTKPSGVVITATKPLTTPTIMPIKSSKPKVFSHLLLTRTRLLDKLSKTPVFSSIIAGDTSENIIARIMPGIISAINPRSMRIPVIMLTANKESTFVRVKLKEDCRFTCPRSSISDVDFIVMPIVKALVIQLTIPDKNREVKDAAMKAGNHASSCCGVGSVGAAGMIMTEFTAMVTNPVKTPKAKKGIKYCTKFREYKLKVCVNISPMESSL